MHSLGRFFSPRDLKFIGSINGELIGDIIQNSVTIFKICAEQTKANIYGESDPKGGKKFYNGVECTCHIDKADINTKFDEFGSDRDETVVFKFLEADLKIINIYPEVGDIIGWNNMYFECNNIIQQQFLGNIPEKSLSIIVNTHYTRISKLSLVNRQF